MKVRRKEIYNAIQWKGWPHKIKGLTEHALYPQLATISGEEVYPNDWILEDGEGSLCAISTNNLKEIYEKVEPCYNISKLLAKRSPSTNKHSS